MKQYQTNLTQSKISQQLTPTKNGHSLDDERIRGFFAKRGFNYTFYNYNETPFNEPDYLLSEIQNKNNHIIVGINTHAYLLIDFNDPNLKLLDPKDAAIKRRELTKMMGEMKEKGGGFGLATLV